VGHRRRVVAAAEIKLPDEAGGRAGIEHCSRAEGRRWPGRRADHVTQNAAPGRVVQAGRERGEVEQRGGQPVALHRGDGADQWLAGHPCLVAPPGHEERRGQAGLRKRRQLVEVVEIARPAGRQISRIAPQPRQADGLAELRAPHRLVIPVRGDLSRLRREPPAAIEAAGERGHRRLPAQEVPAYERQAGTLRERLHGIDLCLRGGHVAHVDGGVRIATRAPTTAPAAGRPVRPRSLLQNRCLPSSAQRLLVSAAQATRTGGETRRVTDAGGAFGDCHDGLLLGTEPSSHAGRSWRGLGARGREDFVSPHARLAGRGLPHLLWDVRVAAPVHTRPRLRLPAGNGPCGRRPAAEG